MSSVDLSILSSDEPTIWAQDSTCRQFSALTVALCVGSTTYPNSFLSDEGNNDFAEIASDLAEWVHAYIEGSESLEEWKNFLSNVRRELLDDVWKVYDPNQEIPKEKQESVGDILLGASIFWEFAASVGLSDETDGPEWASLWFAMTVDAIVREQLGIAPSAISVESPLEERLDESSTW
jgi:hypothetical protein